MLIVLGIIAYIVCMFIFTGVWAVIDPDYDIHNLDDDDYMELFVLSIIWPVLTVGGLIFLIIKKSSYITAFVCGFFSQFKKEDMDEDDENEFTTYTCTIWEEVSNQ